MCQSALSLGKAEIQLLFSILRGMRFKCYFRVEINIRILNIIIINFSAGFVSTQSNRKESWTPQLQWRHGPRQLHCGLQKELWCNLFNHLSVPHPHPDRKQASSTFFWFWQPKDWKVLHCTSSSGSQPPKNPFVMIQFESNSSLKNLN